MSLVGKYGDWHAVNKFNVDEVLDMLEFESISADIEHYKFEQSKGG